MGERQRLERRRRIAQVERDVGLAVGQHQDGRQQSVSAKSLRNSGVALAACSWGYSRAPSLRPAVLWSEPPLGRTPLVDAAAEESPQGAMGLVAVSEGVALFGLFKKRTLSGSSG